MRIHRWIVVALLAGSAAALAGPRAATAAVTPASVSVDAAADLGAFNNPAWYQNTSALGPADLGRVHELAPRVARGWANVQYYYQNGVYQFNDTTFDQVDGYADRMMINFGECAPELMTLPADTSVCREVIKEGIRHHKERHPDLQYIEFFNEPDADWNPPVGQPRVPVSTYYQWYQAGYHIINELNAALNPAIPLRIGGPAAYKLHESYLTAFLAAYANDTDPGKRLDFLSFHEYGHGNDPEFVKNEKQTVRGWLSAAGLDPAVPVFVTEYGVFPGDQTGTTPAADHLTQAAAMATLGGYYAYGGIDMAMHWVYEHPTNERKSMFVNDVDGSVYPYYNVVRMQRMLRSRLLAATSSALDAYGIGVNALATGDATGVAVLTTNYQWTTGTDGHTVTVDVQHLPASWAHRKLLARQYLIDSTHSNYLAGAGAQELQLVEQYELAPGAAATAHPVTLEPNAIGLLVLTPAYAEGEALTPAIATGDALVNITDTAASGGALSLYTAKAAGNAVTYTLGAPVAGAYELKARIKETATRGVAQPSVNGIPLAPIDTYYNGYRFVDADLGTVNLPAGDAAITFAMTPGAGGGLSLGIDTLYLQPRPTTRIEAESRAPASASGDPLYLLANASASGGAYLKADTDAAGDAFSFSVYVPDAGPYDLWLGARRLGSRGTCQLSAGGVAVGAPIDEYGPAAGTVAVRAGSIQVTQPGLLTIGCAITGHNLASTGYDFAVDYVELVGAAG